MIIRPMKIKREKKKQTIAENIDHKTYVNMAELSSAVDPYKYNIHCHLEWQRIYQK
jgi:hypothetical protein